MPRRIVTVTIRAEGRDVGKQFILREMPAEQAEAWGTRALLAIVRGGGPNVTEETVSMGLAGLAVLGIGSLGAVQYEELKPLLKEMMECVTLQTPSGVERALNGQDDIEEIATLLQIRKELLELHVGFSLASVASYFRSLSRRMMTEGNGQNTQTSAAPLDSSSAAN
jgi:hypothetical protein